MRKLNLYKARRIIRNGKELAKKEIEWEVPNDLKEAINRDDHWETFVSLGKWTNSETKYILISKEGKLIYLEKEIIKEMWRALNEKK